MLFTVSQLPTGTLLPCSELILSMAKNQLDVENLVKNCLKVKFHTVSGPQENIAKTYASW